MSVVGRVWTAVSTPAAVLHELTHWLVSLPWAEQSAIIADDEGLVHGVDWATGTPRWAIVLTSIAPTLLGACVGLVGVAALALRPPATPRSWLLAAALAAYWVVYVVPSPDDLDFHDPQEDTNE